MELSDGPISDPLTPQSPAAEQREWADTPAAAPDPARLGRVTTGRGRPSARADRGSAVWGTGGSRHLVRRVTAPDITTSTASSGAPRSPPMSTPSSAPCPSSRSTPGWWCASWSRSGTRSPKRRAGSASALRRCWMRRPRSASAAARTPPHIRASPCRAPADQGRHRGSGNRTGHLAAAAFRRCPRRPGLARASHSAISLAAARRAAAGPSRPMSR